MKVVTKWTRTPEGMYLTVVIPPEIMKDPLASFDLFNQLAFEAAARSAEYRRTNGQQEHAG